MKLITTLALLLLASISMAQNVPNTFTAGTPARAAEVNENFSNLDGRVNTNANDVASVTTTVDQLFASIEFAAIIQTEESVAAAICPVDTLPISVSCVCEGDGSTRNFGVLFACTNAVDGAVAGCYVDFLYDPFLPPPLANVGAVCISATLVNGDPALTNPWSATAGKTVVDGFKPSNDTTVNGAAAELRSAATNQLNAIAAKSK